MPEAFQPTRRGVLAGTAAAAAMTVLGGPAAAWTNRPPLAARQRERSLLNDGWRFDRGDASHAAQPGFDDSGWREVSVPHTWNPEDAIDDQRGYYRGPGWYRRTLRVEETWRDKQVFLYFEGANQTAEVFVEGSLVATHVGGYLAFCADVTDELARSGAGAEVTLAVRVDNSHDVDVPPLSGDFTFYGGLYRNVWLVVTEKTHLDLLDHGSSGVYVDTSAVSASSAAVHVRGRVVNDSSSPRSVAVTATVLDAGGARVAAGDIRLAVRRGASAEFDLALPRIRDPHLWSPDSPYLYTVRTVIEDQEGNQDRVDSPLGFRWYSVDAATGFRLNGRPYPLRGANRHQDIVGKGNALTDAEHVRDLELIKEMGANVVRLAHYPQAPAVHEAADRLGLILWEESPLVNEVTMSERFVDNSITMQVEMIRQHYNHPSVVFWGYMNEIFLRVPRPEPEGYEEFVVGLARRLEETTRAEDPRRLTVMAVDRNDRYNSSGIADLPMILGWNLYHGWYYDTPDDFGPHLDKEHADHPDRPLWVSEYGADSDSRLHVVDAQHLPVNPETGRVSYQDQSIEFQQLFNETYMAAITERPYLVGTTLWAQFEFGSEQRAGSIPHVNQKGVMHPDRSPKDVYHLYRALWLDSPVLHIATREWNHRAGTTDAAWNAGPQPVFQPVKVYSNLETVQLSVNGRSLGRQRPDATRTAVWRVPFVDGLNRIVATGAAGGRAIEDSAEVVFSYQAPKLADPSVPFRRLAVSAGAVVQYTDPAALVWVEDQEYADGGWGAAGGRTGVITNAWINESTEDPLYQTYREGMSSYRFDVPAGRYRVRLRLTEPTEQVAGRRIFDVRVNDAPLVEELDLVARVGPRTAYDVTGTAEVRDEDALTIGFAARAGLPVVSGLHVERL